MPETLEAVAERLLTEAWSGTVRLGEAETIVEDKCFRFPVADSPAGTPASVIIKKARPEPGLHLNPDAMEGYPAQPLLEEM